MKFTFNDQHYLQIGGTFLSIALAPNYRNLFMDRFESKAFNGWDKQPLIWLWFIDDIFMIWNHGQQELDRFIKYINNIHDKIKFTREASTQSINFLDTAVKIDSNRHIIFHSV